MVPCPGACLSLVFRFQLSSEGFSGQSNCRKHQAHIILHIYIYVYMHFQGRSQYLMQLRSEDARSDSKNPTAQCAMQCSYIEPRLRQISRGRMSPQKEQAWHAWAAFCSSLSFFKRPRQEPISGHHLGSQSLERQLLFCRQQFYPLPEIARVHLESLQADLACSIAPRQSRQSKHGDYGQTSGLLALSAEDAYSLLFLSLWLCWPKTSLIGSAWNACIRWFAMLIWRLCTF